MICVAMVVTVLAGCAPAISKHALRQVDREISFSQLHAAPEEYKGKTLLVGGVIVDTVNKKEGTVLTVYQTALDASNRPTDIDTSEGRFLALYEGLLDGEIYRKGRLVTVVGVVQGARVMPLGEIDYRYPLLRVKEIHLWKVERPRRYEPYPYDLWDPWWAYPWYPWYPRYPWRPWPYPYRRHPW
jgi:outer membrane lipoprotein